jgi:hypothetical protein
MKFARVVVKNINNIPVYKGHLIPSSVTSKLDDPRIADAKKQAGRTRGQKISWRQWLKNQKNYEKKRKSLQRYRIQSK